MKHRKKTSIVWKLDIEIFSDIVRNSRTFTEMLTKIGLPSKGGNNKTLKARIIHDGLDISHISLGVGHNRGQKLNRRGLPINDLLTPNSSYSRTSLKRRLISEGLLVEMCAICGLIDQWNGIKLVMILDHINGISDDNSKENLRLICPNCNSQLLTHCGRHNKRVIPTVENGHLCPKCQNKKHVTSKYCRDCRMEYDKERHYGNNAEADKLELIEILRITNGNMTNAGKHFKVSSTSIKKRCEKFGVDPNEYVIRDTPRCACGGVMNYRARECTSCYRKRKNYVERPSRDVLITALTNSKTIDVAFKFKVSRQVVYRWCRSYGIPTKNKQIEEFLKHNT